MHAGEDLAIDESFLVELKHDLLRTIISDPCAVEAIFFLLEDKSNVLQHLPPLHSMPRHEQILLCRQAQLWQHPRASRWL